MELKPRDFRQPHTTPEALDGRIEEILQQPVDTLEAEAAQLEAAHQVLHQALQQH